MIEPRERILHLCDGRDVGQGGPAQHDDGDAEGARCGDLAQNRIATAVLGDDEFDAMFLEKRDFISLAEGPAPKDVLCIRYLEWRVERIDAADQIMVLRRRLEDTDLVPPDGEEHPARQSTQRRYRVIGILHFDPLVAGACRPCRTFERDDRDFRACRRHRRMRRDGVGIGMGGINQHVDALRGQIVREAVGAAETANPHWHRLGGRMRRAAGKRKRYLKIGSPREAAGQLPRLVGAAEYEYMPHVR